MGFACITMPFSRTAGTHTPSSRWLCTHKHTGFNGSYNPSGAVRVWGLLRWREEGASASRAALDAPGLHTLVASPFEHLIRPNPQCPAGSSHQLAQARRLCHRFGERHAHRRHHECTRHGQALWRASKQSVSLQHRPEHAPSNTRTTNNHHGITWAASNQFPQAHAVACVAGQHHSVTAAALVSY